MLSIFFILGFFRYEGGLHHILCNSFLFMSRLVSVVSCPRLLLLIFEQVLVRVTLADRRVELVLTHGLNRHTPTYLRSSVRYQPELLPIVELGIPVRGELLTASYHFLWFANSRKSRFVCCWVCRNSLFADSCENLRVLVLGLVSSLGFAFFLTSTYLDETAHVRLFDQGWPMEVG